MKFIHCADLHLDSALSNYQSDKASIRREEILQTFERMCSYANENSITAVIISGDVFDTCKVTKKASSRFLNAISNSPLVDFLYLSGNHDNGKDFLSESDLALPKNLKVFTNEWREYQYGDVVICGAQLDANGDYLYDSLNLDQNKINVVVMHGQVVNYATGEDGLISIPRLKNKNIDYLALGHIHSYDSGSIDDRGEYVYSGCLEGRGFDETGEKGFVLLNVENKTVLKEFIPFSSRNLYEFEYDLSSTENFYVAYNQIYDALVSKYSKSSIIKVTLVGEHCFDYDVDVNALSLKLRSFFFYVKVKDKTKLKIDENDYVTDKSVRGEFVRAVWESDLDEDVKSKIIMCGIKSLKGENV